MSVPNKSKIDELRSETQLHCEKPKNAGNCDPSFQVCLFNITADPCELNNLAFKVGEMSIVFVKCVWGVWDERAIFRIWTQNDFCSSQMFWKHWMKLWNCIRVQKSLEEINQLTHGQIPSTLIILGQTGGITCHTTKSSQMELTIFTWLQKWWTNNESGENPAFSSLFQLSYCYCKYNDFILWYYLLSWNIYTLHYW